MTWTTFVKLRGDGNFEDEGLAQPIPIPGRASINKIIRFDWSPEIGGSSFDLKAGNYELRIYGWINDLDQADLEYKASFRIGDKHLTEFNKSIANGLSQSIWLSLDESEIPNQKLTESSVSRLYSKQ
jgi:hypothetical protein